jgi:hypothetical protein
MEQREARRAAAAEGAQDGGKQVGCKAAADRAGIQYNLLPKKQINNIPTCCTCNPGLKQSQS